MLLRLMIAYVLTCQLIVLPSNFAAGEESVVSTNTPSPFTADEFRKHVAFLASDKLSGRSPGSDGSAAAAKYIIEHYQRNRLAPILKNDSWLQEFPLRSPDLETGRLFGKNVIAVLPGKGELQEEAVVVCAHYDHLGVKPRPSLDGADRIYNGADDNASGVSALLLIAQAMAGDHENLPESHRTVIFVAFDAEEQGLLGARFYAQRPPWPLDKTAVVINFDCIGQLRLGKFFASDVETNPMLAEVVRKAAQNNDVEAETRFGGHGRSDHAVFLNMGIPSMHFFTGASINYHQVTDHAETVNHQGGAMIASVGLEVLREAMTYPGQLEYQKLSASTDMQRALGLVQALGIVPNVNTQQGRYPEILFVTPGSPAAKHGLKAGDQITALNGIRFTRVEDALIIFQQLTFDEGLRIEVLRKEKPNEISIPPEVLKQFIESE